MKIKAVHIDNPTTDVISELIREAKPEWAVNWVIDVGDVIILADSNTAAVLYAEQVIAGLPAKDFDGRIKSGMRLEMRQRIATALSVDWHDVAVSQRQSGPGNPLAPWS